MGLRKLHSTTWYLHKVRLRTRDHFPVVVKIDGKGLRAKKGKNIWAGWIPRSEDEKIKFQELVLCSGDGREGMLRGAVGWWRCTSDWKMRWRRVKATTTAMRNKNKFTCPAEIREMAAEAAKCRDPVRRKSLRKKGPQSTQRIRRTQNRLAQEKGGS